MHKHERKNESKYCVLETLLLPLDIVFPKFWSEPLYKKVNAVCKDDWWLSIKFIYVNFIFCREWRSSFIAQGDLNLDIRHHRCTLLVDAETCCMSFTCISWPLWFSYHRHPWILLQEQKRGPIWTSLQCQGSHMNPLLKIHIHNPVSFFQSTFRCVFPSCLGVGFQFSKYASFLLFIRIHSLRQFYVSDFK